ncbi:MAG: sulfatase-like hydrolase/transferase [Thermoplasmata archaeon]
MAADGGRSKGRPNLLFVILDAARAQASPGGGTGFEGSTPTLDALIRNGGTTFDRLIAPANWTIPAHMSFFTGTYPSAHGLRSFVKGPPPFETVASWLNRRGYATGLFTEQLHLVSGYGLEDGFEVQKATRIMASNDDRSAMHRLFGRRKLLYSREVRNAVRAIPPLVFPINAINYPSEVAFKAERTTDLVPREFDQWVTQRSRDRPFFAFVNLVNCHEPYPELDGRRHVSFGQRWYSRTGRYYLLAIPELQKRVPWPLIEDAYRQALHDADAKLARLLESLDRAHELDRTLVIVTSDHGQSFGEGGNVYHGCGATESIARVPAVVVPPKEMVLPPRIEPWVSLTEASGWLRAAASGRPPFDATGKAPFPYVPQSRETGWVYFEGGPASDQNRSLRGIRNDLSWNHRLVAAYAEDTKYQLDLVTGDVKVWKFPGNPDVDSPTLLQGPERAATRTRVFEAYERLDAERVRARGDIPVKEAELDAQMRSWGYE